MSKLLGIPSLQTEANNSNLSDKEKHGNSASSCIPKSQRFLVGTSNSFKLGYKIKSI